MTDPDPLVLERTLTAAPERVFAAWHEPQHLRAWVWGSLGDRVEVERRAEGRGFTATTHRPDGARWSLDARFTSFTPNQSLAFDITWSAPMGYECDREHAIVTLTAAEAGTHMRFEVHGLPPQACADHRAGWNDALDHLERLLRGA